MYKSIYKQYFFLLASAVLSAWAFMDMNIFIILFSWAPFIYVVLNEKNIKLIFFKGFVFGFIYGLCLFNWTQVSLKDYSTLDAFRFLVPFFLSIFYGFIYSFFAIVLNALNNINYKKKYLIIINNIAFAASFVIIESVLSYLYQGIPFLNLRIGFVLGKSLYFSQLASIGGVSILTFIIILTNVFIADLIKSKNKIDLIGAFFVVFFSITLGFVLFSTYENESNKSIKVSVVSGNINPKVSWSETTGNILASNYFSICNEATKNNPDFVLWPESVFPWVYEGNDDLIKKLLKINNNQNSNTIHVFGLNSKINNSKNEIANSVLFINKENKKVATYYKNILLECFEKPLFDKFQIPFAYSEKCTYAKTGKPNPVDSKFGKAGILICNESIEENFVNRQESNGANFFFVIANDGWFKDTYISLHHFYIARILAAETRKDFAISSNCGYNGFIKSSGEIVSMEKSENPLSISQKINDNKSQTIYCKNPFLFISILILFISTNLIITPKTNDYD
ncbi:MAG: apolipoprotein N-acyltransferase [Flavobacterium sp.]|uniref:apolipoprotein N-acyltransferase n=1 Tax=Flavobacterium sp. TaxID=239 RepID=UPI002615D524|nr:apolipoprotein N-acyltransferase [Flavobacterium sp.]MDD5149000.1 apolipoprotein N-acyltransferase [Flavobacterium sp.]